MANNISDLRDHVAELVRDERQELFDNPYPEDRLQEIVDGAIPIYYSELAEMLADDNSLAYVDDSGLLPEKPDVWKIIQLSIYEILIQEAYETWEEEKAEMEEETAD
jgi:hypothetical protein